MKKKRLERLITLLRKDARNTKGVKFDLRTWASPAGRRSFTEIPPAEVPDVSCGTAACAMGLAVISGEFKKEGLRADWSPSGYGVNTFTMRPILQSPEGTFKDFDAACALFNISTAEAEWLFAPNRYKAEHRKGAKGERYVANRIAKLIEDNGVKIKGKRIRYTSDLPHYNVDLAGII